jgi:predicted ATPase
LQRELRKLNDADLLHVRGLAPDATYQFKHALIRDAAYEALLKSRRKDLHRQVAQTIDQQFPALKEARPEVLARHWTEAGEIERAIPQWSTAAQVAQSGSAFKEALDSYQRALELVSLLPESSVRRRQELTLAESVLSILLLTKGIAATETVKASDRLVAMAEEASAYLRKSA